MTKAENMKNTAYLLEKRSNMMLEQAKMEGILTSAEEKLVELMSIAPRKRFGITSDAGYCVWDIDEEYEIDPTAFLSMGRSSPFTGKKVFGKCLMTVYGGKTVWQSK